MKLSKIAIRDFKTLYRDEYGEELTDEEANFLGIQLLTAFKTMGLISQNGVIKQINKHGRIFYQNTE